MLALVVVLGRIRFYFETGILIKQGFWFWGGCRVPGTAERDIQSLRPGDDGRPRQACLTWSTTASGPLQSKSGGDS